MSVKPGQYTDPHGNEYEVIGTAIHDETREELVIYRSIVGDEGFRVRPAAQWSEVVGQEQYSGNLFTHNDAFLAESYTEIYNDSPLWEKAELFFSLFPGRDDVYAERWGKDGGKNGYGQACHNEWSPICEKAGGKVKCGECKHQDFIRFSTSAIEKHLSGQATIGLYPVYADGTCRFLAFDFDGKDFSPDALRRDVSAMREAGVEAGLHLAMERSRSGNGIHFWLFFSESIPARTARKLGSSLITRAMRNHHEMTFKTYDRMFPNQDTLPKGGFGNLIALPLQKIPSQKGNSVFIDDSYNVISDQWLYLNRIPRYDLATVERLMRKLSPAGELGGLNADNEDEKPWEGKKAPPLLTRADFPANLRIVRANMLYIRKEGLPSRSLDMLKRLAAFRNPEYYKAQAMRKYIDRKKLPRIISCSDETEQYLCLPRGLEDDIRRILHELQVENEWIDETNHGRDIDVTFNGTLYDDQQKSADALLIHNTGILSAATAFGKTVVGAFLIGERRVNTLILVHRQNLLSQWMKQLQIFLAVLEEPAEVYTPTGRKKKRQAIGQIGAGKDNRSGIVDVAMMQSLVSGDEVDELVKDYGMVIVDECHHAAAFTYEQILKAVKAKYVYGMTATPKRKDGHHPIINMHFGAVRYQADALSQAEARLFEHFFIPRFTRFCIPPDQEETKWMIWDIYRDMQNSEIRNELIVKDVIAAVTRGRNPIILTERVDHVKRLADKLKLHIKNVIPMTGGGGNKKSRELFQTVEALPEDEPFVLVATGKFVGEGFDMPRLDTLFLAMPISWEGTVQQYAGRLHRSYKGKKEVQIFDYVDVHIAMLENMYHKRVKTYASIGYMVKAAPMSTERANAIYSSKNFFSTYVADLSSAQSDILIASPTLAYQRVTSALRYLSSANARVTVVTNAPDTYDEADKRKQEECFQLLLQNGVTVKTKDTVFQMFAIIDQRIVWYGNIHLLNFGNTDECILRIDSVEIAAEFAEILHGWQDAGDPVTYTQKLSPPRKSRNVRHNRNDHHQISLFDENL